MLVHQMEALHPVILIKRSGLGSRLTRWTKEVMLVALGNRNVCVRLLNSGFDLL